uniref:NADH-ubiquinone oxidoreductase chain 2 n=1 Tax=Iberobaenia minuta TaxID=1857294 RepID=A0A3G1DGU3_9COLE|nr:NADH deshydrogenase subunit 2 [Iberobaenia minuta]
MYKTLLLTSLMLSTIMSISSYTWLGAWIGLEINLLSMIPLMQNKNFITSNESSIKYFMIQALSSSILMISINMMMINSEMYTNIHKTIINLLMNISLLTKMGMAPFHFWLPEIIEGLSWINCTIMLTWQKIAPMIMVMYLPMYKIIMEMIIMTSIIIGSIMTMNQTSLRKLMLYSSINNMGWMMSTIMISETIWLYYFIIYSMMTMNLTFMFNKSKMFSMNQMYMKNMNSMKNLMFSMNLLSLAGLPPFLGFISKWMTIQVLIKENMLTLMLMMTTMTIPLMFIYTKMIMTTMIMKTNKKMWNLKQANLSSKTLGMMNFMMMTLLLTTTMMFNLI